jgi:octaprenyl-diphosphate synthase
MTSENKEYIENELNKLIKNRSERILEKFGQVVVSQVTDSRLLSALQDVKRYWRDFNRPTLTCLSCEAVGGNPKTAETAGLMFTLASAGFGIHDDILDRSSSKHLRKTIFGLHGIDTTLLVGDLLIVKAWTIAHEIFEKPLDSSKIADILKTYGRLSVEICEAEFMETLCRRKLDTKLSHFENVLWKEMAETEVCCRVGAMIGDGRLSEIEALSEFGRRIGFISRLANEVEDCLNIKGDLLHRVEYESIPLPLLYAAQYSSEKYAKIGKILAKKHLAPLDAKTLLKFCFETEAFEYVRSLAKKNEAEATCLLGSLRSGKARDALFFLINSSYVRVDSLCI